MRSSQSSVGFGGEEDDNSMVTTLSDRAVTRGRAGSQDGGPHPRYSSRSGTRTPPEVRNAAIYLLFVSIRIHFTPASCPCPLQPSGPLLALKHHSLKLIEAVHHSIRAGREHFPCLAQQSPLPT